MKLHGKSFSVLIAKDKVEIHVHGDFYDNYHHGFLKWARSHFQYHGNYNDVESEFRHALKLVRTNAGRGKGYMFMSLNEMLYYPPFRGMEHIQKALQSFCNQHRVNRTTGQKIPSLFDKIKGAFKWISFKKSTKA